MGCGTGKPTAQNNRYAFSARPGCGGQLADTVIEFCSRPNRPAIPCSGIFHGFPTQSSRPPARSDAEGMQRTIGQFAAADQLSGLAGGRQVVRLANSAPHRLAGMQQLQTDHVAEDSVPASSTAISA